MGQRNRLGRTLLIEAITTVPAVMFPVRKGERRSAAHTDIGIGPFGWLRHTQQLAEPSFVSLCHRGNKIEALGFLLTALLSIMLLATVTRGGN